MRYLSSFHCHCFVSKYSRFSNIFLTWFLTRHDLPLVNIAISFNWIFCSHFFTWTSGAGDLYKNNFILLCTSGASAPLKSYFCLNNVKELISLKLCYFELSFKPDIDKLFYFSLGASGASEVSSYFWIAAFHLNLIH